MICKQWIPYKLSIMNSSSFIIYNLQYLQCSMNEMSSDYMWFVPWRQMCHWVLVFNSLLIMIKWWLVMVCIMACSKLSQIKVNSVSIWLLVLMPLWVSIFLNVRVLICSYDFVLEFMWDCSCFLTSMPTYSTVLLWADI